MGLVFDPGEDCVLHVAAAKGDIWTLECILDYCRLIDMNIDIEDSRRCTSLESAILAERVSAVEILLENGASVVRRNDKGQTPLHLAAMESSSVEIASLLLQNGADTEALLLPQRGRASIPVYLAFERLKASHSAQARDALCSFIETLLRSQGSAILDDRNDGQSSTMTFLESWVRWEDVDTLARSDRPSRPFRLSHFLRQDCDPLCWLPRSYCPGQECKSLASFIFAHTSGSGLPQLLVRSTDVTKFGRSLLYCLLSPCTRHITSPADFSTHELVLELLERMDREEVDFRQDPSILRQILHRSSEPEKLTLIELVRSWGLVTVEESREVFKELSNLDDDFRLHLTEILLSLPGVAGADLWTDLMMQNFTRTGRMYIRQGASNEQARIEFQDRTLLKLHIDPSEVTSANSICIIQCVMYYWTKKLLEGDTFDYEVSNQQRVFGAVQSRQKYDLPPLPISGDLILSIFPHLDHRNRGNSVTSAPS